MSEYGRIVIVSASTWEPVTRAEAKAWLKIEEEETADDPLIDSLVSTARRRYEEIAKISIPQQTFEYVTDESPCEYELELPRAPLVSITSIKGYTDTDGPTDTGGTAMSSSGYYVDSASMPGRVVPFGGAVFPTATRVANGFIVRFVAGYSSGTSGVPEQTKTTLKRMIAAGYEHRGDEDETLSAMDRALRDDVLALQDWG